MTRQLIHVDPGAAVDLRREFVRQDEGAHAPRLPGRSRDRRTAPPGDGVEDALDLAEVEWLAHHRHPCPDLGLPASDGRPCTRAPGRRACADRCAALVARSPPRPSGRSSSRITRSGTRSATARSNSDSCEKPRADHPASLATSRSSARVGSSSSTANRTGRTSRRALLGDLPTRSVLFRSVRCTIAETPDHTCSSLDSNARARMSFVMRKRWHRALPDPDATPETADAPRKRWHAERAGHRSPLGGSRAPILPCSIL